MAEAKLNFNESELDKSSALYNLYSRLYDGMCSANRVDAPDYSTNPPLDVNGQIDTDAIAKGLSEHADILMKNSAYMMSSAIVASVSPGGGEGPGTSGPDCMLRTGDSMSGMLNALYGFKAGHNNKLIFETTTDSHDQQIAYVYGHLNVKNDIEVRGQVILSDSGLLFSGNESISCNSGAIELSSKNINLLGDVDVDGSISVGSLTVTSLGIFYGEYEYYHSGNSNNNNVDWTMKNGHIYGDFIAEGSSTCNGFLSSLYGFKLGDGGKALIYSNNDVDSQYICIASDLSLSYGYGIKLDGTYVIKVRDDNGSVVSLSAPGKILNLGDSDGETKTNYIALQTPIFNYSSAYQIISENGDGNFPNSFKAGCGNSGPRAIETYYTTNNDYGTIAYGNIRLGSFDGPILRSGDTNDSIEIVIPYLHVNSEESQLISWLPLNVRYVPTTSLFKNQSTENSASLQFNSDAEFFTFKKPVESVSFSIISEKYKTRLIENALFFNDGSFIEGVSDGLRLYGNVYCTNNVSSPSFSSGIAGSGWAIKENELAGGYAATFDELTVRKKARFYELEVQKHSITNGALWVSDSCSGDIVEEIA